MEIGLFVFKIVGKAIVDKALDEFAKDRSERDGSEIGDGCTTRLLWFRNRKTEGELEMGRYAATFP